MPISTGERYIDVKDIMYLESNNNRCVAHIAPDLIFNEGKLEIPRMLRDMENQLSPYQFCRPNQKYLVNPSHIVEYIRKEGGIIMMSDGKPIYVSPRYKEDFHRCRNGWN